jgi:hypothetical protein
MSKPETLSLDQLRALFNRGIGKLRGRREAPWGNLSIWRCAHSHSNLLQVLHLRLESRNPLLQAGHPCFRDRRRLPIGPVQFSQITCNAFLDLLRPRFELSVREVLIALLTSLNLLPSIATFASEKSE